MSTEAKFLVKDISGRGYRYSDTLSNILPKINKEEDAELYEWLEDAEFGDEYTDMQSATKYIRIE